MRAMAATSGAPATDAVAIADQIRAFVPQTYTVLGTDGFGRSDTRVNLRRFFEVDRYYIAHAAIAGGGRQDDRQGCGQGDQAVQD